MAKFLKNSGGSFAEENTVGESSGVSDAGKVVHLNSGGRLDNSLLNSAATSAGAADANKVALLNGAGKIDATMLPSVSGGGDCTTVQTSEALAAGDFVNIFNSSGARARKADATTAGKEAHGFVKESCASGASATVYFEGANDNVTGQTPGVIYLSTTPGLGTATPPTGAGNVVQRVGFATSATSVNFQAHTPVTLA